RQDRGKPAPQRVFNGAGAGVSHTGIGRGRPRDKCDLATWKSPKREFVAEVATASKNALKTMSQRRGCAARFAHAPNASHRCSTSLKLRALPISLSWPQ